MASRYLQQYPIPADFPSILRDLTREILRLQPKNIIEFSAKYFKCKIDKTPFTWEQSKSRGPRPCDYPKVQRPPPSKVVVSTHKAEIYVPKKKTATEDHENAQKTPREETKGGPTAKETTKGKHDHHSRRESNHSEGREALNISGNVSLPSNPDDAAEHYVDNLLEKAETNMVHA